MKCKCGCNQITPIAKRNRASLGHIKGKHIDYCFAHALRGRKRIFTQEWKNRMKASVGDRTGANNPNWQGGLTNINQAIRNSIEYKEWRKAVYKRDNYTCIDCGSIGNGKNLQADHIKPFSVFPELRFDIDNGRTLCIDCHKQTDSYGWKATNNYIRKLTI